MRRSWVAHLLFLHLYCSHFCNNQSLQGLPIFVDRIRKSDFSVFDDRETETRPNTLIEIGAAIGLGKPHFYFNYENKRTVRIGKRCKRITTAGNLARMLFIPYEEHDALFREFAVRLPLFLCDRHFATRLRN